MELYNIVYVPDTSIAYSFIYSVTTFQTQTLVAPSCMSWKIVNIYLYLIVSHNLRYKTQCFKTTIKRKNTNFSFFHKVYLPSNLTIIDYLCFFTVSSIICYYFHAQNNVFLLPLLLGIMQQYGKRLHLGMDYEVNTN